MPRDPLPVNGGACVDAIPDLDPVATVESARQRFSSGDLERARELLDTVLTRSPDQVQALYLTGLIALQTGDLERAASRMLRAVRLAPNQPCHFKALGNIFKRMGRFKEAEASFLRALKLSPDFADAHYDLGVLYQLHGRFQQALVSYRSAVDANPAHASAWNNLGMIHLAQGDQTAAIDAFDSSVQADPCFSRGYHNLGIVFQNRGDLEQAVRWYQRGLDAVPGDVALTIGLGSSFLSMRNYSMAVAAFREVSRRQPDNCDNWVHLGYAHQLSQDYREALRCYEKALSINPDNARAYLNMGLVFKQLGRSTDALACFEKAVTIDGENGVALNDLVVHLLRQCEWEKLPRYGRMLDDMTHRLLSKGNKPCEDPFLNLVRHDQPMLNFNVAKAWSADIQNRHPRFPPIPICRIVSGGRIRIGLLSANFRNHPGADLILSLLENYDAGKFEIYCYSWSADDGSEQRQRIVHACDTFVDIENMDDRAAAERIRSDGVQILIDLLGYLKEARLGIAAHRPAPVQIRYLGFVGSTGADFFDYMIADAVVAPERQRRFFSEKLILMPHSYLVNNYASEHSFEIDLNHPKPQDAPFVFCCFNTAYKLDPELFGTWMNILLRVPKSELWLMPESSRVQINLKRFAEARGVDARRCRFKEKLPKSEHFKRLATADLVLDTRHINGVASTTDALWVGVPVVTLAGSHFGARTSASFLHTVGLPEMVAQTISQYESIAVRMGTSPQEALSIRRMLLQKRSSSPLFDTQRLVSHLETAFHLVWQRFISGQQPETIILEP